MPFTPCALPPLAGAVTSPPMTITRDQALALVHEYTQSEPLRRHMYAVELSMRALAGRYGENPDDWGLIGLLHDFDYERFPNAQHSATEEHPAEGVRILAERGLPEPMQRAILGHASYTGVPRDSLMARGLFAVDELAGFLVACALVRPSKSLADLEVSSVRKKLKDKAFARGVSREDVMLGADELGVPLEELVTILIAALRPHERLLGLGTP
ncbi:MAG: metal dependent phosphohydrolase [Gemmatimonadetes bacterium]|nr:metal dependent phosphohydrolase [Gemmatimonadota bacterium]